MNDVLSGSDLVLWLSVGLTRAGEPMRELEELVAGAVGIELDPGSDLELGRHAWFEPDPLPDRGVLHAIVQDNPAGDPVQADRTDCAAVAKVTLAGDLLDLGRLADRLTRAAGDALVLLAWGLHEPVFGPDVFLAALGSFAPADDGRPPWLARLEPGAAAPRDAGAGSWLCQLSLGVGEVPLDEAERRAGERLAGAWSFSDELHGPERVSPAGEVRQLGASLRFNRFERGEPLFPGRPDGLAILRLSWTAASPVEVGWLAAVLERDGMEALGYRMAGAVASDGLVRLMTGPRAGGQASP